MEFHDRRPGRSYTDADIHPKVAEGIIEATRQQAARDHDAPLEQTHVVKVERNPKYQPGYPTFHEHVQAQGLDPEKDWNTPEWHKAYRSYNFGGRASHTVEFTYNEHGHRALYGVNMHEEIPPRLWAD